MKTLFNILVYILLYIAAELLSVLFFEWIFSLLDLPGSDLQITFIMLGSLVLTVLLFWLYTSKVLHLTLADFGITSDIKPWGVLISVLLPLFVAAVFAILGTFHVNALSAGDTILIIVAAAALALKSGIAEEMLFRGYIMKSLEARWNRSVAILVPSLLFALLHLPAMETFTVGGFALLLVSGTLVGVMFSLVAYKGNSIANSALLHGLWNFVIITDVLHITTAAEASGEPIFSIIIPADNVLLTGAGFGVEASLIAIIGYALVCGFVLLTKKK